MDRKTQDIIKRVSELNQNFQDYKSVQPLGGASFVNYSTSSSSTYDFSITMNAHLKSYRLTFTHSEPDKYHILSPTVYFRVDNSNVMSSPYLVDVNALYLIHTIGEEPVPGSQTWILDAVNSDYPTSHTFYVKLFFKGTTTGTFSASLI